MLIKHFLKSFQYFLILSSLFGFNLVDILQSFDPVVDAIRIGSHGGITIHFHCSGIWFFIDFPESVEASYLSFGKRFHLHVSDLFLESDHMFLLNLFLSFFISYEYGIVVESFFENNVFLSQLPECFWQPLILTWNFFQSSCLFKLNFFKVSNLILLINNCLFLWV